MTSIDQISITEYADGVTLIDADFVREHMAGCYLMEAESEVAFIEVGTNSSTPRLMKTLEHRGWKPEQVSYVIVTHVHLDHAGGAGSLMQHLPNAKAVIHPRGARHMSDPSRLIAGTESVYGKEQMQNLYGSIQPIDAARIDVADDGEMYSLCGRELQAFYTEGHARHHYCLSDPASKGVFTGDSFGVSYRELDTVAGEFIFPTTTPVHFDPDEAHKSVDRILSYEPERLYLTHYSEVGNLDRLASDMHKGINAFVAIALEKSNDNNRTTAIQDAIFDYFETGLVRHGYKGDRDMMWSILKLDVDLNTQGIEVWLDKHG